MKNIKSIAISGRMLINLHDLNNEMAVGNKLVERRAYIFDEQGELFNVNCISGDMMKHIFTDYFTKQILEHNGKLCTSCSSFNANRILADSNFLKEQSKTKNEQKVLDALLEKCSVDDVCGSMVATKEINVNRKSIVEFGILTGLPEKNRTSELFHAKYVVDSGNKKKAKEDALDDEDGDESASSSKNDGQNIFYTPSNSGFYAFSSFVEVSRLGLNDISGISNLTPEERQKRYQSAIIAMTDTVMKLSGAKTSTNLPHQANFNGVITVSESSSPATMLSALDNDWKSMTEKIVGLRNEMGARDTFFSFDNTVGFVSLMKDLYKVNPF